MAPVITVVTISTSTMPVIVLNCFIFSSDMLVALVKLKGFYLDKFYLCR